MMTLPTFRPSGPLAQKWQPNEETIFVAILDNFNSACDRTELTDGTTIRKQTEKDKQLYKAAGRDILLARAFLGWSDERVGDTFLVETRERGQTFDTVHDSMQEKLDRIRTALRVLGFASASITDVVFHQPNVATPPQPLWPSWLSRMSPWPLPPPTLQQSEVEDLNKVYARLLTDPGRETELAVRRFDRAHARVEPEEKLLDLWIGLEALFSPSDTELRYRIALRVAYFIGSSTEREDIYSRLLNSYDWRSYIAHGRTGKAPKGTLAEALESTEDYLRRALRRLVVSPEPFVPEKLDILIARGQ